MSSYASPPASGDAEQSARESAFDPDQLEIRAMQLEDIHRVFSLGERLFTPDRWPSLYRTWDEYEVVGLFGSDGDFCFVADLNQRVVGFALGTLIEKRRSAWKYGYLLWLGTDPGLRRMGIARQLVDRFTEQCIDEGARMMLVDTAAENDDAVRFFKQQGYGKSVQHVYMSKNLTTLPQYKRKRKDV
jgi:ribosomal protein S18 acetylase RimI-like enzyme